MGRPFLRHLRRSRVLFALALCAWLGVAATAFAKGGCCVGMHGMAAMPHQHDASAPMHADGLHTNCPCAHMTATMPAVAVPAGFMCFSTIAWQALPAIAPELANAPPLRPPLI